MKPSLARAFISFGRVKASDRKITSGSRALTSRISHSQNGKGLVCGLSTRKIRTPCAIQNSTISRNASHSRVGMGAGQVGIDDVFVFLGRVLGIADGAVGPPPEPFRMLRQPRVVGRALDREVERNLHVVVPAGRDEAAEVREGAELGMDGVVAALGGADRIEASRVVGGGLRRVVAALAVGAADRMDRREIDHVEAHPGDVGQPGDAVVEGAVPARHRALAARHHLVPCPGAGERAVDNERQRGRAGEVAAGRAVAHRLRDLLREQRRGIAGPHESVALTAEHIFADGARRLGGGNKGGAFQRVDRAVLSGRPLEQEVAPPGRVVVGPGLDRIFIKARLRRRHGRNPAVVAVMAHRDAVPERLGLGAPAQGGRGHFVSVAEYVGPDVDGLAGNAFDRKTAPLDARIDVLNHVAAADGAADGRPTQMFHVRTFEHACIIVRGGGDTG